VFLFRTTSPARLKQTLLLSTRAAWRLLVDCCCPRSFGTFTRVLSLRASYCLRKIGQFTVYGLTSGKSGVNCTKTKTQLTDFTSNGSYTQYCDLSRQYDPVPSPNTTTGLPNGTVVPAYNGSGIGTFLEPFGRYDLLEYMNTYWIAQNSPNQDLWGVSQRPILIPLSVGKEEEEEEEEEEERPNKSNNLPSTNSPNTPPASPPSTSPATAPNTPNTKKSSNSSRRSSCTTAASTLSNGSPTPP
jgi:hypothetical protein